MGPRRTDGTTGLARIPLIFLEWAESHGLPRDELLDAASLTDSDLDDPDARLPLEATIALWKYVIERDATGTIGLDIGSTVTPRSIGLVGYTMISSANLRDALERYARYHRIVSEAVRAALRNDPEGAAVEMTSHPLLDALAHPVDSRIAALVAVAGQLTGTTIVPCRVAVPYGRERVTARHRRIFGDAIETGVPVSRVVFSTEDLGRVVASADPALMGYLERLAEQSLAALGSEESFADALRRAVWADLSGGRPSLDRAARRLGVATRTAQRRLNEEGTSFREVLDRLRRELAPSLLRDGELAVYEVAFLLGYAEPSTFHRAFRRWHGTSPRLYRRRLAGD